MKDLLNVSSPDLNREELLKGALENDEETT